MKGPHSYIAQGRYVTGLGVKSPVAAVDILTHHRQSSEVFPRTIASQLLKFNLKDLFWLLLFLPGLLAIDDASAMIVIGCHMCSEIKLIQACVIGAIILVRLSLPFFEDNLTLICGLGSHLGRGGAYSHAIAALVHADSVGSIGLIFAAVPWLRDALMAVVTA